MADQKKPPEKSHWIDDKANIDKIWYALIGLCVISVLADFLYHKHVKFNAESIPGMYGWFGLGACVILIFLSKILQSIVRRKEDYYDGAEND